MIVELISGLAMPLVLLLVAVLFMIMFRAQIQDLLGRLDSIVVSPKQRKIKAKFHQKVMDAKRNARGITATVAADRSLAESRSAVLSEAVQNHSRLQARDVVLGAWGRLKQILYDACAAKNLPLTPSTSAREASARLYHADWIGTEVVDLIDVLHELAQQLASDTTIRPDPEDAGVYEDLANVVLSWMMINVLPAEYLEPVGGDVPRPRVTEVGGGFRSPRPGKAAALLIGVSGPVRGRQYAIEQTKVKIGADRDNDLFISNDQYVSAKHAVLRYEQDNLFLSDERSSNGTFLNENQVTSGAVLVRAGDRIRLGESVFQVSAPGDMPATEEFAGVSNQ